MLDLGGATSLEVLHASVGGKSGGIPETHGRLHAEFILECAQRRCSVVGPVSPGASGQTILGRGSYGRDQKLRVAISRLLIIIYISWSDIMCKQYDTIWHDMVWYDIIWYAVVRYDMIQYDMLWCDMICIMMYKQNWRVSNLEMSCLCACFQGITVYQLYNLSMSHHETIHSRHILQLNLLASICVNIAVRTISTNEKCGVLKTWLARNKLQKLRTHHANWHRFVLLSSTMLILLCWCSTLLHSFSHTLCGVSFLVEL